jgi:hypothetical protein
MPNARLFALKKRGRALGMPRSFAQSGPSLRMTSAHSGSGTSSLFGLAPCGVCPARGITAAAVRSYRTFSPLPRRRCESFIGCEANARVLASQKARWLRAPRLGPWLSQVPRLRSGFRLAPQLRSGRQKKRSQRQRGGMFSVALSVAEYPTLNFAIQNGPPAPGRYPAHCSAEFGLSSPPNLVTLPIR